MIRIRYTFKSASGKISWDDKFLVSSTADAALIEFQRLATSFVLKNLTEIVLLDIIAGNYKSEEFIIQGCEQLIADFIAQNK